MRALAYRAVLLFERAVKNVLFGCSMCGQCVLSYTGFTCPMRCPKQLRNGPCGGTAPGGRCEVYPERPCVWCLIVRRSERLGRLGKLERILPTLDWRLWGTSAWLNLLAGRIEKPSLRSHAAPADWEGKSAGRS